MTTMGGNALNNTKTRRYSANEYYAITDTIMEKFKAEFPDLRMQDVKAYRSKESFGDLDIVIEDRNLDRKPIEKFLNENNVTDIVKNGPVWSVGWNDFQVDLIFQPEYEFSLSYFSWNDLGNLTGRISRSLGFKFGHNGLWYTLREGGNKIDDLLITNDFNKALSFLGFDAKRHSQGFEDTQEIFQYVVNNEYFSIKPFLLEKRSNRDRTRDKKRATYVSFLDFIQENETIEIVIDKNAQLIRARECFPEFSNKLDLAIKNHETKKIVKTKFNGAFVSEITGLTGKDLGLFMGDFKNNFENFEEYILNVSVEDLTLFIKEKSK